MQRKYKIYTLNARDLISMCEKGDYSRSFDLNSGYIRSKLIRPVKDKDCYYSPSALLDQIMFALNEDRTGSLLPESELTKHLVFLDFGQSGIKGIENQTQNLLYDGFSLLFPGEKDYVRFTPFEKSASMSRKNVISFIDKNIFARVDQRLGLDLDWRNIKLVPSKFYAYRGLYLTDGIRIDYEGLRLNAETVIIIKGDHIRLEDQNVITVNEENCSGDVLDVSENNVVIKNTSFDITTFDGEGFISPNYASMIRTCMGEGSRGERSTSFQIRMPFSKGMLHEVDFKQFINNEFPENNYEDLVITDYFGIKRKLKNVEIIMTDSMFKCGKWLEQFKNIEQLKLLSGMITNDPMLYYFEKMHEYNHAMYIISTNRNIRSKKQIKMSYQFLNTLDMERLDFEYMIKNHMNSISLLRSDPIFARESLLGDDETSSELKTWEYALKNNPAFLNDPLIRKEIATLEKSRTSGIMEGKINVEGTIKYLSMDLLGLLIKIAELCNVSNKEKIDEWKDSRNNKRIKNDCFYLAGWRGYGLQKNEYYGFLRNPHLSRNEQCALRPFDSSIYNTYFGGLKGVVMTSYESVVPTALAGADFDGDMVKIVFDKRINNAILNGSYEVSGISPRTGTTLYKRKLPIALINSPNGPDDDKPIGDIDERNGERIYITLKDVESTFSSRVGHISNLAIDIGRNEYNGLKVPSGSTALCTIATGLEIDSVKTGIYPDLSYLENLCEKDKNGFMNVQREFKRFLEDDTKNGKKVHGRINAETGKYEAFLEYRNKPNDTIFSVNAVSENNIDILPYLYVTQLIDMSETRGFSYASLPKYRFVFENNYASEKLWRSLALNNPKTAELEGIIGSYRKIVADIAQFKRVEKQLSWQGHIIRLMQMEYDIINDVLPKSRKDIFVAINAAYQDVYDALDNVNDVKAAISRMIEEKWEFVYNYERRVDVLSLIVNTRDFSPATVELLCDCYDNGYQILYYVLLDILEIRQKDIQTAERLDENKSKWSRDYDRKFYDKLYDECYDTSKNHSQILKEIESTCRERVVELFGQENIEEAIQCTVALDKEPNKMDENHSFLWNVFTIDDIKDLIYKE